MMPILNQFEELANQEAVDVLTDILAVLKMYRRRPDASGARVAAIGRIQMLLEQERAAIQEAAATPTPDLEEVGA